MAVLIDTMSADEFADRQSRDDPSVADLWQLLDAVKDPEIPALSIHDLGILRAVRRCEDAIEVIITPTYSGCPAMKVIEDEVRAVLEAAGHQCHVQTRLSPAWTTRWMNAAARERLRDYGIAAPLDGESPQPACPLCGSGDTRQISEFGSTACKALHQCNSCLEPFDYFKQI